MAPKAFLSWGRHRSSGGFTLRRSWCHLGPFCWGLALTKSWPSSPRMRRGNQSILKITALKGAELDFLETQGFTQSYHFLSPHFITSEIFKGTFFTIKSKWRDLQIQNHQWHACIAPRLYLSGVSLGLGPHPSSFSFSSSKQTWGWNRRTNPLMLTQSSLTL